MTKTIEIDDDAFSCVTPKRSIDDILDKLDVNISDETLAAIDESLERRKSGPASRRGD